MAGSFKRVGNDRVRVRLAHDEVAVLRGLPDQLRTVLGEGGDEPVNQRLFPPAYLDVADIENDTEYQRLMHEIYTAQRSELVRLRNERRISVEVPMPAVKPQRS